MGAFCISPMHAMSVPLGQRSRAYGQLLLGGTKIGGFDPSLAAVCASHAAPPRQEWPVLFHPIELAAWRPCGCIHMDRWIDFAAIRFAVLTQIDSMFN